ASGMLFALLAVQWVFGGIHGITLAFGVTLLGVAIDYPLHLISHRQADETVKQSMQRIWPTLRLGVLSTCIAYLTLLASEFNGLAQLGLFTVVGLLVAAVTTRWLLPLLLPPARADVTQGFVRYGLSALQSARLPMLSLWLVLLGAVAVLGWGQGQLWQNDLAGLTPVPAELQKTDAQLRRELGAAELRHLLVIEADDQQAVLAASEQADETLQGLIKAGQLRGYDHPARYLPSQARQQARQAALPAIQDLRSRLAAAVEGLPFKEGLFDPFLDDVAQARSAPPITAAIYADSPMQARLAALLKPTAEQGWRALIPLQGIQSLPQVAQALNDLPHARLVDLKTASENMVAGFRNEALWRIAAAGLAIVLIAVWGLPRNQWLPVLLPVATTVLAEAALFQLAGLPLTLFHLISLMLVGGIVLDYALFFNRKEAVQADYARTLHALTVCAVSTLTVFGILALSEIPVLRAIGVTVAAGVLMGYSLTALTAQGAARVKPEQHASTKTQ
ncbi:MAG: MMPL family transporter, partial [Nevskiales bacterium]